MQRQARRQIVKETSATAGNIPTGPQDVGDTHPGQTSLWWAWLRNTWWLLRYKHLSQTSAAGHSDLQLILKLSHGDQTQRHCTEMMLYLEIWRYTACFCHVIHVRLVTLCHLFTGVCPGGRVPWRACALGACALGGVCPGGRVPWRGVCPGVTFPSS